MVRASSSNRAHSYCLGQREQSKGFNPEQLWLKSKCLGFGLRAQLALSGVEQVTLNTLAAGAERYLEQLCRRTAQIRDHTFSSESLKVGKFLVSINYVTCLRYQQGGW